MRSGHAKEIEHDGIGQANCVGDKYASVQPRVVAVGSFEDRRGAAVILGGGHEFAARHTFQNFGFGRAQTAIAHLNVNSIVSVKNVVRVQFQNAVRAENLPVRAAGQYSAAQMRAFELAGDDIDNAPRARRPRAQREHRTQFATQPEDEFQRGWYGLGFDVMYNNIEKTRHMNDYENRWKTVLVSVKDGIAWVTFNRPEKRNAMSPLLNTEMREILETLELDPEAKVVVLTGAGTAWTAGMDLKEYFREVDGAPEIVQEKIRRDASMWQWKLLRMYSKPTIAMVNGWCFGGGFSPLVACDLAIAADTAIFGLSEINWGIPPGNLVSKALADTVGHRKALEYIMTGDTFTGVQAAAMGLVNKAVSPDALRAETIALAEKLMAKNPVILRAAKHGFKRCRELTWEQSEDYLYAKLDQSQLRDPERGREKGLKQFLDDKSIKPGLQTYKR